MENSVMKVNRSKFENLSVAYWQSPVGWLEVQCTEGGLRAANFVESQGEDNAPNDHCTLTINQLTEYFAGKRQIFDLPFDLEGSPFQLRVWAELLKIPFGKTCAYMDIAKALGDPKTIRAVGLANGSNKISIIIPCHRVIGSDGSLTGYAGGLHRKKWLLEFENPPTQLAFF
jgi:methylated-DNA-[protein]-cysteine S-methyltransferase